MEKIDFKQRLRPLYLPSAKDFSLVDVPAMNFLMVDGAGNPNISPDYVAAIEALYSVSYTLKFASKAECGKDYVVPPLEGLWWAEDMSAFATGNKDAWKWTMMVMQPEWLTRAMVDAAIDKVRVKSNPPALDKLRFESFAEGRSVQILHIGSYQDEWPVLARMHSKYMPQHHLGFNGKHHEIYLSDPRKVAPAKLKTVLRQAVKAA